VRYLFHLVFHVMGEDHTFRDDLGRDFDDLEDAKAHAAAMARELILDRGIYQGFAIQIIDDRGNEVARVTDGDKA
jgi:hypothetical protein